MCLISCNHSFQINIFYFYSTLLLIIKIKCLLKDLPLAYTYFFCFDQSHTSGTVADFSDNKNTSKVLKQLSTAVYIFLNITFVTFLNSNLKHVSNVDCFITFLLFGQADYLVSVAEVLQEMFSKCFLCVTNGKYLAGLRNVQHALQSSVCVLCMEKIKVVSTNKSCFKSVLVGAVMYSAFTLPNLQRANSHVRARPQYNESCVDVQ